MENGLKMGKNATFSTLAQCSSPRRRLLRQGKATCLQLALSFFTLAKDRLALANSRVVLTGSFPFTLVKVYFALAKAFTLTKVVFALANLRPSLSSVFSFASAKLCFWQVLLSCSFWPLLCLIYFVFLKNISKWD